MVIFLMVFIIQSTANGDTVAMHV
ncbi:hypothetical protein, partial [Paraburkholderia sp. SIMBA_030]